MPAKVTKVAPKIVTYPVTGNTLQDVWKEIQKKGPTDPNDKKKVVAITSTDIVFADRWIDELRRGQSLPNGKSECVVGAKTISISVEATVKLPKLGANKLSKPAKAEWERFLKKLKAHELEHQTKVVSLAEVMGKEVLALEGIGIGDTDVKAYEAGKKDFIKQFVAGYGPKEIGKRVSAVHKKFDKDTKHGAKHGATLKLTIK